MECDHDDNGPIFYSIAAVKDSLEGEGYIIQESDIPLNGKEFNEALFLYDEELRGKGLYISGGSTSCSKCEGCYLI